MEETECIVCFFEYDDTEHRPRALACGHSLCTECLEDGIRSLNKSCPKCRALFTASNVNDIPINFSLEGVIKLLKITKVAKESAEQQLLPIANKDKVPECIEHQLPVSNRCKTHKSWVCLSCIYQDHPIASCNIITLKEELAEKKDMQITISRFLIKEFEDSSKKIYDYNKKCKRLIEEDEQEIGRYEEVVQNLQKEIKRKKTYNSQMKKIFEESEQKLDTLKENQISYDLAISSLKASDSIKEVSKFSVKVQKEAEKLKSISTNIENNMNTMLQAVQSSVGMKMGLSLGNHKLSMRNGKQHLHAIQRKFTPKLCVRNFDFSDEDIPPVTDGILTFLDFRFPGEEEPKRVYIKMKGCAKARARQHLLLVTGSTGHSYLGLSFTSLFKKGKPGEALMIGRYDGDKAMPLLTNVTVDDVVKTNITAGVVCGGLINSSDNNATFNVKLRDRSGITVNSMFGIVTEGLEFLKEIADSDQRPNIKVVDCGLVLF